MGDSPNKKPGDGDKAVDLLTRLFGGKAEVSTLGTGAGKKAMSKIMDEIVQVDRAGNQIKK